MDNLERLADSIDQALGTVAALRREILELRAELDHQAGLNRRRLQEAEEKLREALRAQSDPAADAALLKRVENAEAELDQVQGERDEYRARAAELEEAASGFKNEAARLAAGLKDVQERLSRAEDERDEFKARNLELEELLDEATRSDEKPAPDPETLQALQAAQQRVDALAREKAELELKVAEAADPVEVDHWHSRLRQMEEALAVLRQREGQWAALEAEQAALKKEKKALAAVRREREETRRKLEEINQMLENLRL